MSSPVLYWNVRPPLSQAQVAELQAEMPKPPPRPPAIPSRRELLAQKIDLAQIFPLAGGWSVPSDTGRGRYIVVLNDEDRRLSDAPWWERHPQCTCMDFQIRHGRCKHIAAVFRKLAPYELTMGEAVQEFERIMGASQEWS